MRRRAAEKRNIAGDARYGNVVFGKFINVLMLSGKKSVAEAIFYGALDRLAAGQDPTELVLRSIANVRPSVEVRSRRVGGATYQVPVSVAPVRAEALALRWIIDAARKRSEKTMVERLAAEMKSALEETGAAVKKRVDMHKMAAANQAFAHYRW